MENIIICGNGNLLQYVIKKAKDNTWVRIEAIYDQIESIAHTNINQAATVLLAVSWHEIEIWIDKLKLAGAKKIYRIPVHAMQYKLPLFNGESFSDYIAYVPIDEANLLYLETHLADTCNLKCRGCMHFSNLATDANFPDIENFKKDFQRLAQLFRNIFIIRLMGGEPFLNPRLDEYVSVVRECFPASEIRIVTNGLLIPQQKTELWKKLHENFIGIDISPYPPTMENIDVITKILDKEHIPYGTIAETLHKFRKSLSLTSTNNPHKSTQLCQSSHCRFLRNGKISKCPLPLLIDDFNKVYHSNLYSSDYYDIYQEQSGEALKEKLDNYIDMCKFCPDSEAFIDWARTFNDAKIEDWITET